MFSYRSRNQVGYNKEVLWVACISSPAELLRGVLAEQASLYKPLRSASSLLRRACTVHSCTPPLEQKSGRLIMKYFYQEYVPQWWNNNYYHRPVHKPRPQVPPAAPGSRPCTNTSAPPLPPNYSQPPLSLPSPKPPTPNPSAPHAPPQPPLTPASPSAPTPCPPYPNEPSPHAPTPAPTPHAPSPNAPTPYAPSPYAPTPHAPSPNAPTPYAPSPYAPTPHAPSPNAPTPTPYAPSPYAPTPHAPSPNAPTPYAPSPYAPTPHAPSPTPYAPTPYAPSSPGGVSPAPPRHPPHHPHHPGMIIGVCFAGAFALGVLLALLVLCMKKKKSPPPVVPPPECSPGGGEAATVLLVENITLNSSGAAATGSSSYGQGGAECLPSQQSPYPAPSQGQYTTTSGSSSEINYNSYMKALSYEGIRSFNSNVKKMRSLEDLHLNDPSFPNSTSSVIVSEEEMKMCSSAIENLIRDAKVQAILKRNCTRPYQRNSHVEHAVIRGMPLFVACTS
ncbi:hypothetical protein KP509_03G082500 [Ceratopteris richardii]|uniref:Uncharacterized protein n=1 Tax=Ceratopteris richardii TaxID=49495 RepID=A0A8T2V1K8_CERRI|nr:hypothetical protein KP509_03G082500 [Ceratopteris richardii]